MTYIVYQLYPVFSQLVQFQTSIGLLGNFSQLVSSICKLLTILLYYSQASIAHRSYYVTPPPSLKTTSSVDMVHSSKTLATTTRLYPLELSPVQIEYVTFWTLQTKITVRKLLFHTEIIFPMVLLHTRLCEG